MHAMTTPVRSLAVSWVLLVACVLQAWAAPLAATRTETIPPDLWSEELELEGASVPDRVDVIPRDDGVVRVVVQLGDRWTAVELRVNEPGARVVALAGEGSGDCDLVLVRPTIHGIIAVCLTDRPVIQVRGPPLDDPVGWQHDGGDAPRGAGTCAGLQRETTRQSLLLAGCSGPVLPVRPPSRRSEILPGSCRPAPQSWATIPLSRGPPSLPI